MHTVNAPTHMENKMKRLDDRYRSKSGAFSLGDAARRDSSVMDAICLAMEDGKETRNEK